MIKFLIKGVIRDKNRSLMPVIIVSLGVAITVVIHSWLNGIMDESLKLNMNFNNGHVRIMTRAYAEEANQMPLDLALLDVNNLINELQVSYPDIEWVSRIKFGALIDFPDSTGETRAQGPVVGWAIDLFSPGSKETERFNITNAIVAGQLPSEPSHALISADLAERFRVKPGDRFTLFGTTMEGSLAFRNFIVSGTLRFGTEAIDRGAVITDLNDARQTFSMEDAATEILGFFRNSEYDDEKALTLEEAFNDKHTVTDDEFSPEMFSFSHQEGMGDLLAITKIMNFIFVFVFVAAMSVVLWNTGLLGGLRRYSEFGIRLAIGESKGHIFKTLLAEGVVIGIVGTICGTALGLAGSYFLQEYGLDMTGWMKNASLMFPTVARAYITPAAFYIGIIPGLISTTLGNALAGSLIYKRDTSKLFKELEV